MPDFVLNNTKLEHVETTLNNITKGWQHIKGCHLNDDQQAINVLISIVVSQETISIRQANEFTGIHKKNWARDMRGVCL